MKKLIVLTSLLGMTAAVNATLITNGDFSAVAPANANVGDTNNFEIESADNGWGYKASWSLTSTAGAAEMNATTNTHWALAQINSVDTETGSSLTFTLDWTPVLGATITNLEYQLVGWKGTPTASTDMFRFINGSSLGIQGGGATPVDLLTGTVKGTGNSNTTSASITGTAGSTTNYSTVIDLSGYGAGNSDVSDYDYIGLRISIAGNDTSTQGSLIDNVTLTVPEPSSYALIGGLCALASVMVRRRK